MTDLRQPTDAEEDRVLRAGLRAAYAVLQPITSDDPTEIALAILRATHAASDACEMAQLKAEHDRVYPEIQTIVATAIWCREYGLDEIGIDDVAPYAQGGTWFLAFAHAVSVLQARDLYDSAIEGIREGSFLASRDVQDVIDDVRADQAVEAIISRAADDETDDPTVR
jgi:hypothetical protein